jgi:isoleucyl-tRNA synthetase
MERAEHLVSYSARPVFRTLGERYGGRTQVAAAAIRDLTSEQISSLVAGGSVTVEREGEEITVRGDEVDVVRSATGGLIARADGGFVVALDTTVTPELRLEGLARELVNRVQNLRKETGLDVQDRIRLGVFGDGEILEVARDWGDFVRRETLATELESGSITDFEGYEVSRQVDLDGVAGTLALARRPGGGAS